MQLNKLRAHTSDHVFTAEEILEECYPKRKRRVIITHDPDCGALGSWQDLKAGLKGKTVESRSRRKNLRPFNA